MLDDITLYWLTNSATSSGRLYWEYGGRSPAFASPEMTSEISLPVAITVFPGESYRAPETWARRAYPNLVYFHEVDKGAILPHGNSRSCFPPSCAQRLGRYDKVIEGRPQLSSDAFHS